MPGEPAIVTRTLMAATTADLTVLEVTRVVIIILDALDIVMWSRVVGALMHKELA